MHALQKKFFNRKIQQPLKVRGIRDKDRAIRRIKLYVKNDIPSSLIAFKDKPIESLFIELNLQNTKILINCSYNPHKSMVFHLRHYTHISKINLNIFGASISISKSNFYFEMELRFQNGVSISKSSLDLKIELRFQMELPVPRRALRKHPDSSIFHIFSIE